MKTYPEIKEIEDIKYEQIIELFPEYKKEEEINLTNILKALLEKKEIIIEIKIIGA